MPKARLTDTLIRDAELPEGSAETVIWDTDVTGLGLRIRPGGKSFIVFYRPAGAGAAANSKRLKIGTPQTVTGIREVRRIARETLGKVAGGGDPSAERREARRSEDGRVDKLLDRYELHMKRRGHVNCAMTMSVLRRRLRPFLSRDVASVKGWELAKVIERLDESGLPGAANGFRTHCITFLNWCTFEAKALGVNPLAGYRRARKTRIEKIATKDHGRALTDAELAAVWNAADVSTTFGRLVRFLILSGCRRSEAAGLQRAMIDEEAGRIDLPAAFTKQARGHAVHLTPALQGVLDACPVDARNPGLVFASPRTGGPISGWSKFMNAEGKSPGLVQRSGVAFTLHDLRRTFRTGLSRLKVDTEIAELALGHARADLEARYNRDDCGAEVAKAFALWSDHVSSIVGQRPPSP